MIGDLSSTADSVASPPDSVAMSSASRSEAIPPFSVHEAQGEEFGVEPRLSNSEEDTLLKDTTGSFADWVASFVRRVIQLLENLPEEGAAGGASEGEYDVSVSHLYSLWKLIQSKWWMPSPAHAVRYVFTCRTLYTTWCCVWYLTMRVRTSAPMQFAQSISLWNALPTPIPLKHWPNLCPSAFGIFSWNLKMEPALFEPRLHPLPSLLMQLFIGVRRYVFLSIYFSDIYRRPCNYARDCL